MTATLLGYAATVAGLLGVAVRASAHGPLGLPTEGLVIYLIGAAVLHTTRTTTARARP
jgi:hypothetical protein